MPKFVDKRSYDVAFAVQQQNKLVKQKTLKVLGERYE